MSGLALYWVASGLCIAAWSSGHGAVPLIISIALCLGGGFYQHRFNVANGRTEP